MRITHSRWARRTAVLAAAVAVLGTTASAASAAPAGKPAAKPTIVLVHGAWADASSFAPVTVLLQRAGYTVLNAPNPLRGLADDSASVAAFVDQATTGPVVLVGHSYGGAVITNAAVSAPRVKALTYVDAYAPDQGETVIELTGSQPGSALAGPVESVFDVVQDPKMPAGDVDLYVKRALFPGAFAAHLPAAAGAALAAAEAPIAAGALQEESGVPAWKTLPSWFVIGNSDRVIPPAEQQVMAKRAKGHIVTVNADHLSMLEAPGGWPTLSSALPQRSGDRHVHPLRPPLAIPRGGLGTRSRSHCRGRGGVMTIAVQRAAWVARLLSR